MNMPPGSGYGAGIPANDCPVGQLDNGLGGPTEVEDAFSRWP